MTLTSLVAVQSNIHPGPNLPGQVKPGEEVVFGHEGVNIKPFEIVPKLASGDLLPECWYQLYRTAGIEEVEFIEAYKANVPEIGYNPWPKVGVG
jgi:hypothetical protein